MKRSRKIILTSIVVVLVFATVFALSSLANMIGDVNGDNKMDNEDVIEILNDITGGSSHIKTLVDVNNDGVVDVLDAISLKTIIASIQDTADGWCAGIYWLNIKSFRVA